MRALDIVATLLLAVPWLQPYSYGPTPSVVQWLVVWASASVCWLLFGVDKSNSDQQVRIIANAWAAAAVVSAVLGLAQYLGVADIFGSLAASSDVGQAYANLRQRNQLATLLNMGLAALLWRACLTAKDCSSGPHREAWTAGLIATAIAATGSRTGLLQVLLLAFVFFLWRRGRFVMIVALSSYVIAAFVLPVALGADIFASGILSRVTENSAACTSRLTLWSNVLHLIAQKPWFGWGWGELDYAHFITLYSGERFCEILDNAHNLPLHLAVELGVPVAVVFCAVCGWLVWRNRPWADTHPARQLAWVVLAVIGLHSLLEYPLWYGPFQLAVALCIWMLWVMPINASLDSQAGMQQRIRNISLVLRNIFATILIAFSVYAAWDYWRISQIYLAPDSRNVAYRDDTLAKIQNSWLFQDQVNFAELTITPLTQGNATHTYKLANDMLHFSPEPRVIEAAIESAELLGLDAEALGYRRRYEAAFPERYSAWRLHSKPNN